MNRVTPLLLGIVLAAGCGSSGGTNSDMGAGSGDMSGGGGLTCAAYCTAIMANCSSTTMGSATQQYSSMDNCMNSCKVFPVGTAADTSGNTLGCRIYHANAAKGDPMTHCPHAGPGGDGVCGKVCDGYCQLAMAYCTQANMAKVYDSLADCMAVCMATPNDVRYNDTVQDGAHAACLLYHAQEASTVPPDHCIGDLQKTDGGANSVTCM